eukprot:14652400-Alexandrium_andersonii.AAC.1
MPFQAVSILPETARSSFGQCSEQLRAESKWPEAASCIGCYAIAALRRPPPSHRACSQPRQQGPRTSGSTGQRAPTCQSAPRNG